MHILHHPGRETRSLLRLICFLILAMGPLATPQADETDYNLKAVDNYILPAYTDLAERTQTLVAHTAAFCRRPDRSALARTQESFHQAMDSWQTIQPVRLGPIETDLRGYRLQFWPDKRQSVSRHLATLLDKADPTALQAEAFARGSVAVQGFSALERLLFASDQKPADFGAAADGRFRCRLIRAISGNLAQIATEIVHDWDAHRELIASAARGNAAYADSSEVSARLLNSLYTQLELMLDKKLRAPLGDSPQRARGSRSESWRSGRSLENLSRNLDGLRALTKQAFLSRLVDPPLTQHIRAQLDLCKLRLEAIETPLKQAVKDPTQRPRVEALASALSALKGLMLDDLAGALEIPVGFNSLDGD